MRHCEYCDTPAACTRQDRCILYPERNVSDSWRIVGAVAIALVLAVAAVIGVASL